MIGRSLAILLVAALPLAAAPARADAVSDFYRGKRINLVIGYGTGGGYDLYARMLARFLPDHIPGKPMIVPQNMPGAGSRGAANWLFKVAPRDGTVLAVLSQTTPTDQALGQPGVQFDVRKFNWIGNMVVVNNLLFVRAATGVSTIAQAKEKVLSIGATGASSPSVLYPQVSNNLLGTKFRIISGYPGGGDVNIAVERGEVDGRGSDSWASLQSTHPDWLRDHKINILFQVGNKREAGMPDVPLWSELGQNDEQRQILEILSGDVAVGRPILTAPDVPTDRVKALRRAFDETMADPAFKAAAAEAHMDFNPIGGEELQGIVDKIAGAPADIIAKVKEAIVIKDMRQLPGAKPAGEKE
ncbi:MAG TPA: tripartite tricarboxylate transporter substrate-binding protein [Xanthobacteraceae bacterium]|nr:tripartite tricarboxylate transporter substrate-binding protein [Xanthobacteraceae bacterium]